MPFPLPHHHIDDPIITTRSSKIGGGTFSAVTLLAFRVNNTGKTISDPVPANATAGLYIRPPSDFTPPEGVVVFTGNQSLPSTNTTLNIAASNYNCTGDSASEVFLKKVLGCDARAAPAMPYTNISLHH